MGTWLWRDESGVVICRLTCADYVVQYVVICSRCIRLLLYSTRNRCIAMCMSPRVLPPILSTRSSDASPRPEARDDPNPCLRVVCCRVTTCSVHLCSPDSRGQIHLRLRPSLLSRSSLAPYLPPPYSPHTTPFRYEQTTGKCCDCQRCAVRRGRS